MDKLAIMESSNNSFTKIDNIEEYKINEKRNCIITEMIEHLKKNGIPVPAITRQENIGKYCFPVTYFSDGTIIVDYPSNPLK